MPTITISERTGADHAGIASANLRSNAPTTNYLGGSAFEVTEFFTGDYKHNLFVITNNTGLTGTVTVSGADFTVRCSDASNAIHSFALHHVTAAATASQATWLNRTTADAWTVAGCYTADQSDATDANTTALAVALNATAGTDLVLTGAGLDSLLSQLLSGTISELRLLMVRTFLLVDPEDPEGPAHEDGAPNDFTFAEFRGVGDTSLGPILTVPYTVGSSGPTVSSITATSPTEAGNIVFTVTLSEAVSGSDATYAYSWGGTATSADYTQALTTGMCARTGGASGAVTVSGSNVTAEVGVSAFTITVPTTTDALDENDETVILTLGGTASSTVTITDDDAAPTITSSDATQVGDTVTFTVTIAASGKTVTLDYATSDGTKTAGVDYTDTSGTLTFTPGETSKDIVVTRP
jgi:hypothetical protein